MYKLDDEPSENDGVAEIIIAKQRNGPTGTIKLAFLREQTRFANLAQGGGGGIEERMTSDLRLTALGNPL